VAIVQGFEESRCELFGAHGCDHDAAENVNRVSQWRQFELDTHQTKLLDGPGSADVPVAAGS